MRWRKLLASVPPMLPRLLVMLGLAFLAALPALGGCSSSHRRDQNFGTDAGTDYQIPDAAISSGQATADTGTADDAVEPGFEATPADASAQESGPGVDS